MGLSEQYWKFAYDLKFWSSSRTSCLFLSAGITAVYHWVSLHSLKITWMNQHFLTFALNLCRVIIGWWSPEPPHTHTDVTATFTDLGLVISELIWGYSYPSSASLLAEETSVDELSSPRLEFPPSPIGICASSWSASSAHGWETWC